MSALILPRRFKKQPQELVQLVPCCGVVKAAINCGTAQVLAGVPSIAGTFAGIGLKGLARKAISSGLYDSVAYSMTAAEKLLGQRFVAVIRGWSHTLSSRLITPSGSSWQSCAIYSYYSAPNRYFQAVHRAADGTTITVTHTTVVEANKDYVVEVRWVPGDKLLISVDGVEVSTPTTSTGVYSSVTFLLWLGSGTINVAHTLMAHFSLGDFSSEPLIENPWSLFQRSSFPVFKGESVTSGIPTLSNPLMTALTANGGVPQITLTF